MKKMTVTTSWDDGHELDLKLAGLLKRYGIMGTFYISPKDREISALQRLTDTQIMELSKDFEIGAHTLTHPRLTELQDEEARSEIAGSKEYLEKLLSKQVGSFCYPAGYYNARHEQMVRDAGFTLGRTVKRFAADAGNDPFALPTTVHAYRHWSDAWCILNKVGLKKFFKCYLNWDELAITLFDNISKAGGVFHLWGHSWEIDKNGDWERLERVLEHIASHEGVEYATNQELFPIAAEVQKTVLFVTPYFPPHGGGLEHYAYEIATRLQKDHQWRVVVVTSGEQGSTDSREDLNGLTVYRLGYQFKFSNTPFSFRWFRKIRSIVTEENPAVINIHMPVPGIGDIAARTADRRPVVVTYHADSMHKGKLLPDMAVWLYEQGPLRLLLGRADRIICSSDFVRLNFLRRYLYKSTTITPAVDNKLFTPAPEKKSKRPSVLFVAGLNRAEQYKGLRTLLDAALIVRERIPNLQLVVVGDGDMKNAHETHARLNGLEDMVEFTGRLHGDELVGKYQRAHVFVLPSTKESFGMVILEAMACGVPAIGTDIGGIPDVIDNAETGFVVPSGNSVALAEKIETLLANPSLSESFGRAGREKIKKGFEWSARATATDALFHEALATAASPLLVHIAAYYPPHMGGLERVAKTAAEMLANRGRKVLVLASNQGATRGVECGKNLTTKRLWSVEFAHTPFAPSLLWNLLLLPRNSLMHLHLSQAYWPELVLLASKIRGIPYIVHFHLDVEASGRLGFLFRIYKRIVWGPSLRNAALVIACSNGIAEHISKTYSISPAGIVVIPNAVQESFFRNRMHVPPSGELKLLAIGRLVAQKCLDRLIKALSLLSVKVHLTIVGDGEDRARLEDLARKLKLKNISFVGAKNDAEMQTYHADSHLFLISSSKEGGTPLAVLEAMAAGLPVVGSNVVGIRELVSGTGILIEEPYPKEFAKAIETLYRNHSRLETLSQSSSTKAKEYSLSKFICRLEQTYQEML